MALLLPRAEPHSANANDHHFCGPTLPLLPLQRKVQSLAGLSTLYLSSACVVCLGDGTLMVPSGASGRASEFGAYR